MHEVSSFAVPFCLLSGAALSQQPNSVDRDAGDSVVQFGAHITTATWSSMYFEMSPRKQEAMILMVPKAMLTWQMNDDQNKL